MEKGDPFCLEGILVCMYHLLTVEFYTISYIHSNLFSNTKVNYKSELP